MRRILYLLLTVVLVFGFYACNKKVEKGDSESLMQTQTAKEQATDSIKGIDAILPDNSVIVMKFKNVNSFYKEIVPALKLDESDMTKAIKELGFNPMKLNELNDFGIDNSREFGVVFSEFKIVDLTYKEPPIMNFSIFAPVLEGKDVAKKIVDIMSKKAPSSVKLEKKDGYYLFPGKEDSPTIAVKQYKGYVFVTVAFRSNPELFYSNLGENPVGNNDLYRKLVKTNGDNGGFSLFVNFKNTSMLKDISDLMNKKRGKKGASAFNMFKGYEAAFLTVNTSGPDFILNSTAFIDNDSPVMNIYKDIKYRKSSVLAIKDNPLLYFSVGMNPEQYYKTVKQTFTKEQLEMFNKSVSDFKEKSGIDLMEIINMLGGNFNYAMYDGKSINMMNYNTVFSLSFKDEQKGKELLNKLLEILKKKAAGKMTINNETIAGVNTYIASAPPVSFYIGFKDSSLIFSTGKPYYEQAVSGDIDKGFTSSLEKGLADKFINSDIFYLSFDEGIKVFENFKPFVMMGLRQDEKKLKKTNDNIGKATEIVNNFQYIIMASKRFDNGVLKTDFVLKTRFNKSFILGIIDIIKSLKEEVRKEEPVKKTA